MSAPDPLPVTIVVPARDEAATIGSLLEGLRAQSRPPAVVVVVDAGSVDATAVAAGGHGAQVVDAGPATPGSARNAGVAVVTTPWVAFLDAGITVGPDWLGQLWEGRERAGVDVAYSSWEVDTPTAFHDAAVVALLPAKVRVEGRLCRWPNVPGSLLRAELVDRVGGFPDLRAAEDLVFLERVRASGATEGVVPEAVFRWHFVDGPRALFARYRLYSRHNVLAGRQRSWHWGVARFWLLCLPFVVLSVATTPVWLAVPALLFASRVGRRLRAHHIEHRWSWLLAPSRLAWVALVLLIVDAATFAGWIDARIGAD